MPQQLNDDLALCLAANSRRDGVSLSAAQRELLRAVAQCDRVGDIISYSRLPRSIAERELVELMRQGWVLQLDDVTQGNSSASVERLSVLPSLAPTTKLPDTAKGYSSPEVGSVPSAGEMLAVTGLPAAPAVAPEPPKAVTRGIKVLGSVPVRPPQPSVSDATPALHTESRRNSSAPPSPTLQDLAWVNGQAVTTARAGSRSSEQLYTEAERRTSDIESLRRSSRPPPRNSEVKALSPYSQSGQGVLANAAGAEGMGAQSGLTQPGMLQPGLQQTSSDQAGARPPRATEQQGRVPLPESVQRGDFSVEPLPQVRVSRRSSPFNEVPQQPQRVVTVGARERSPDASDPVRHNAEVTGNRPAVGGMGASTVLTPGSPVRFETPGEMPAVRLEERLAAEQPAAPDSPRLPRELGQTLLGGSAPLGHAPLGHAPLAHAPLGQGPIGQGNLGQGNLGQAPVVGQASGEQRAASAGVGLLRMVVVGKGSGSAEHAFQPAPTTVRVTAQPTLLGVRAPTPDEIATAPTELFASVPANNDAQADAQGEDQLDHYEVIQALAKGGNGVVYRVRDPQAPPGEYLALKVLKQGQHKNREAVESLVQEATLMSALTHPGLVRLHDFGHENGEPFVLMEFIDGLSMSELLQHPVSMPLDVGLIVLQDTLEVLDYVHNAQIAGQSRRGVVHCDVSPQNLLVGRDGRTRLIDFGTSRAPGQPIGDKLVRCKPRYASPELLAGEDVDATTDVFAVGAVLFQVLSRQPAFSADPSKRKRESLIPNPSRLNSRAPTRFDPICQRALDPDRLQRFSSARQMLDELNQAVELSGIVLRRERVQDWVERVMQSREGELQLKPEELQELLGEGKRRSSGSSGNIIAVSSDRPSAAQRAQDTEHAPLPSAPESSIPAAASVEAAQRTLTLGGEEDSVAGVRARLMVGGITTAVAVIVIALAVFKPEALQGLLSRSEKPHDAVRPISVDVAGAVTGVEQKPSAEVKAEPPVLVDQGPAVVPQAEPVVKDEVVSAPSGVSKPPGAAAPSAAKLAPAPRPALPSEPKPRADSSSRAGVKAPESKPEPSAEMGPPVQPTANAPEQVEAQENPAVSEAPKPVTPAAPTPAPLPRQ